MGMFDIGAGSDIRERAGGKERIDEKELGIVWTGGVKVGRILGIARMEELSRGWAEMMLNMERGNEEARHFFRWVGKRGADEGVILRVVDGRVVWIEGDEEGG
jgi:PAS domain-containing protein